MRAPKTALSPVHLYALVIVLTLAGLPTPAATRTWVVPTDAPTIQAGIDSSSVGDTVLVESGTYYEYYVEPKSRTVLISETGDASSVTIDALNIRNVIRCFDLDSTTVIQGFTLKNGGSISYGGGLYASNSDPQITNCTIRNCRASQYGGGMYLTNSSPSLTNCMFYADTADVYGGGLYTTGTSSPYLYDCIFTETFGMTRGGGIYAAGGSSPEFRVCSIELNRAFHGGGGAVIDASQADFTFCYFRSNLIMNENGAGMRCDNGSTVTLTGCTFDRHYGPANGGAISTTSSNLTIDGCTLHMNEAISGGGGIYTNGSTVNVANTIIAFGQGGGAVDCWSTPPTFTCSDIFGNVGGDWVGCIAGQAGIDGNFSEDPRFCSRETANFTLRSCSPCIDAPDCGRVGAHGEGYCPRAWNVPAGAPTIQAGIDSACTGDTVHVACGTYYEHDIDMKPGVSLVGDPGPNPCVVINAQGLGRVMSCTGWPDTAVIEGFVLTEGAATTGGGLDLTNTPTIIRYCHFYGNGASTEGGGIAFNHTYSTVTNCVFAYNYSLYEGGAVHCYHDSPEFTGCTFYGNSAPVGSALYCDLSSPLVQNSIVTAGTGTTVVCSGLSSPTFTCSDVWGNSDGGWSVCIADQAGIDGNFSLDPRLCDPGDNDFALSSASPCLYRPCGLVGALARGCWDEIPYIESVADVGNDQGRQARLTWQRSSYDAGGDTVVVTGYGVYRRQDAHLADGRGTSAIALRHGGGESPMAEGWDYLGRVPARYDSIYQYVAATLCDSTDEGICWSVFMVSAETPDPGTYFDSAPDSGYSIDNLAPAPPPGLMMTSATELAWEKVPDTDFDYYSVYGSAIDVLDETATLIGYTIDTMKDVAGHVYDYYHVTATDFSGNEGDESSVNNLFAGVPGIGDIPATFALRQNRPNPFSTTTVIAFDLPEETNARIRIYDTHGRLIKRLVDTNYEAGRHAATWRGEDEAGTLVGPGVYFIRMEAGEFEDMKKVMLLR